MAVIGAQFTNHSDIITNHSKHKEIQIDPCCAMHRGFYMIFVSFCSYSHRPCFFYSCSLSRIFQQTKCDGDNNWTETEYSDASCTTPIPNTTNSGKSGNCFVSGDYFGQVVCPGAAAPKPVEIEVESTVEQIASTVFEGPVSSAGVAFPSFVLIAIAAFAAIFA